MGKMKAIRIHYLLHFGLGKIEEQFLKFYWGKEWRQKYVAYVTSIKIWTAEEIVFQRS